jgi:hypothetical protein
MPQPPWRNLGWLINTYHSIFLTTFYRIDRTLLILISSLTLIGAVSLLHRDRSFFIAIISPFLFALLASALKMYPLRDRFMLFLIPLWLMLVAEGLGQIRAVISRWSPAAARAAYALPAVFILFHPVSSAYDHFISPFNWVDLKPVMKYVGEHRASAETIYVYHSSDPAFNYYAPLYGIDRQNVLVGFDTPRKKIALQGFISDVEMLQGTERVWFIFSDIVDCGNCEGDMQQFYVDYLDERGLMLDSVHAAGANAYLYDLKP